MINEAAPLQFASVNLVYSYNKTLGKQLLNNGASFILNISLLSLIHNNKSRKKQTKWGAWKNSLFIWEAWLRQDWKQSWERDRYQKEYNKFFHDSNFQTNRPTDALDTTPSTSDTTTLSFWFLKAEDKV